MQSDLRKGSELEERRILGSALNGQLIPKTNEHVGLAQITLEEDVGNCPYATSERCEGVKNPGYQEECLGGKFSYIGCQVYHTISNDNT